MAKLGFIHPYDQPLGRKRLLDELIADFKGSHFDRARLVVAFVKVGPLAKLSDQIRRWRGKGKTIEAVFGVDRQGTSLEALEYARANFDSIRVAHSASGSAFNPTFHPKLYLFLGRSRAKAYIGSNNLTVGGTETNFEAATVLDLEARKDARVIAELNEAWHEAVTSSLELTDDLLRLLVRSGLVTTEKTQRAKRAAEGAPQRGTGEALPFPTLSIKPPSPIPPTALPRPKSAPREAVIAASSAEALVIQIVPHHNGEVFLSKKAVAQNPVFFGFPFTGKTVPKKKGNPSYPQRVPDPVVDVQVFDASGNVAVQATEYSLNTVYYETKSEIRVTMRPDLVAQIPPYAILLMRKADEDTARDYVMEIHPPKSARYRELLAVCNQSMPSGGKAKQRLFGWL